ncbi:hypothetical protein FOQG_16129 [Fusarium oxysporum f. sp. raphani 54005]|uniref:Uncharacterized protein n=2 Tax=Fusarium oxysporum TaxID=5507 RepID=X0BK43_FUSOX|nr:hypothetical protein FOVG_13368 [Fusarium oxysporum f. sp. pisi HDV247]EXK79238.1 hypothetical protein FOQG_16129 [Fusarium oxysporum f. sp. raphani 54005]
MSRTHPPNSQMEVFGELARSRERSYSNMHTSTIGSGPENNTLSNIGRVRNIKRTGQARKRRFTLRFSRSLRATKSGIRWPTRLGIFLCVRTENWKYIYRYPYNPPLHVPANVYGAEVWRIIKDFAIEFDQSWSINRPGNIYDLSEENSARGYLEKLLFDRAHHRNFDGLENIWLIDKGAMWSRHAHQYYCTSDAEGLQEAPTPEHEIVAVYRGCDAEYVEVSLEQCSHKTADGMAPSSKGFVEKLGLESDFVALPPSAQMWSSPKKDSATLARRSVEVGHGAQPHP